MDTFLDLEDRDGLVCIDCGDEVRILIPMSTHPLWRTVRMGTQRIYQRQQQQQQQPGREDRSSTIIPRLSSSVIDVCLRRHRASSWLLFHRRAHEYGGMEEDDLAEEAEAHNNTDTLLHKIISCGAWGFVVLAMIYPYLMIIFIALSQTVLFRHQHSQSTDTTTLMTQSMSSASFYQTAVLFAASAAAIVWSSRFDDPNGISSSSSRQIGRRIVE